MMSDIARGGLLEHDLARLRREWVAAYRAWSQVAEDKSMNSGHLTEGQRAALSRYRAAEAAYFTQLGIPDDPPPDKSGP